MPRKPQGWTRVDRIEARIDVGAYLEVEAPHGAELHVPDVGAPMRFTLDVRGPQGRVVQHDYRPEASA